MECPEPCRKKVPPLKTIHHISKCLEPLLDSAEDLEEDDYFTLIFELIRRSPNSPSMLKKVMNYARDHKYSSSSQGVCGQRGTVDPGAQSLGGKEISVAASKVALICRGDLAKAANALFLDVEKVTLRESHKQVAGDISIVDEKGRLVFWTYISRAGVCMFNTKMTGLNEEKMEMGLEIVNVQNLLSKILIGKVVWGMDIINDWKSLGFEPKSMPFPITIRDLQEFYVDFKGQPISLSYLSDHFLGENKQHDKHSSIIDARVTCVCYHRMRQLKSIGFERFSCPFMDAIRMDPSRNPKNKSSHRWDLCKCNGGRRNKNSKRKKKFGTFLDITIDDL